MASKIKFITPVPIKPGSRHFKFNPTYAQLKEFLKRAIKGGASSTAWKWPGTGAPVANVGTNTVRGTVTMDGSDTTITITHNLGFTTAELNSGLPVVILEPAAAAGHSSDTYISSKTANTVVLTYLAAAYAVNFTIMRVQSSIA